MVVKAVEKKPEQPSKPANMDLWNALVRTDPKATKPFQRAGGFRGSQIDPVWRMQMMTETFGPVGIGWGWDQLEWTIAERMIFVCCRVWYVEPKSGVKAFTGPQWGGTELVRVNRDGKERPDDEAFKMSITDAVGKCFLQIGLAADVYMGQFDDSKYKEDSERFFAADRAKKFLDQLMRTFPDFSFMSEYVNATGRDGFQSSLREAEDADPKTFGLIQALLDQTSERISNAFHSDVKKELAQIETMEKFNEIAPLWRSWLGYVRNKELREKIKQDILSAKTAMEAPQKPADEPKEAKVYPRQKAASANHEPTTAAQTDDLPTLELTYKGDTPRWGALTKSIAGVFKELPPDTDPSSLRMFWERHAGLVEDMRNAGGEYPTYAQNLAAMYNATLDTLDAE